MLSCCCSGPALRRQLAPWKSLATRSMSSCIIAVRTAEKSQSDTSFLGHCVAVQRHVCEARFAIPGDASEPSFGHHSFQGPSTATRLVRGHVDRFDVKILFNCPCWREWRNHGNEQHETGDGCPQFEETPQLLVGNNVPRTSNVSSNGSRRATFGTWIPARYAAALSNLWEDCGALARLSAGKEEATSTTPTMRHDRPSEALGVIGHLGWWWWEKVTTTYGLRTVWPGSGGDGSSLRTHPAATDRTLASHCGSTLCARSPRRILRDCCVRSIMASSDAPCFGRGWQRTVSPRRVGGACQVDLMVSVIIPQTVCSAGGSLSRSARMVEIRTRRLESWTRAMALTRRP